MIWNLHSIDRCITSRQLTKVWIKCTACFQPLLFIVIKYLYCCLSFIVGNTIHSTISCIKNSANQYGDISLKPLPCSTPPLHFTTSPPARLAPKRKTKKKKRKDYSCKCWLLIPLAFSVKNTKLFFLQKHSHRGKMTWGFGRILEEYWQF